MTTIDILKAAKAAWPSLQSADTAQKNAALEAMADELEKSAGDILRANETDVAAAQGHISPVMIDRLRLDGKRISAMAQGLKDVITLPDPCGETLERYDRPDGLIIEKVSVPIGVIAIIYESRPNVTSDAAGLCLKSGNACVLRCGRDAYRSCRAIVDALKRGLERASLPADLIALAEDTSRQSSTDLMTAVGLVDLLIPRGGAGLIKACVDNARVPCIQTGTGICHIYIDDQADIEKALDIVDNAKTSRPSVCNAAEVCLVHEAAAPAFLPGLKERLVDARAAKGLPPVQLRLDERAARIIDGTPAGENDFDTEFLDYILAVRVVKSLSEALEHIQTHSTGHSEAIVTEDAAAAERFTRAVDSAAVYVNASTRFTDGGEFGLGCEIGISTQKLHARGPMGLKALTTGKYIVHGNGHIR